MVSGLAHGTNVAHSCSVVGVQGRSPIGWVRWLDGFECLRTGLSVDGMEEARSSILLSSTDPNPAQPAGFRVFRDQAAEG